MLFYKITIVIGLAFLLASSSFAAARKYPHGCKPVGFSFENRLLILKPIQEDHPQTIYLIHNRLNKSLKLSFIKPPRQAYFPHLKSTIKANQWASFATDRSMIKFVCQQASKTGESRNVDCGKALELCQYVRTKFPESHMGSYWAIRSNTLKRTRYSTIKQGILLKW